MEMDEIEQQVLDQVWPEDDEAEQAQQKFQDIREFIQDEHSVEAKLMGSLAKRTFLAGDKDLDIFIFFPPDTEREELEERGLEIGKSVFNKFNGDHRIEYSEHPYTKGNINGFDVEIVPAYRVDDASQLQSAVDRTPFHTDWVNDHLDLEQKKQVVLLKAFLKGTGLYGSTLRVEGFAGYLCELLIAKYGTFNDLVEDAADWHRREIIDVEDHHPDGLPEELKQQFRHDQLVLIDPTDPERNVASVLSTANYAEFIHRTWQYLEDPSLDHFFPEESEPSQQQIKDEIESRGEMVTIAFDRPDVVDDILYPQIRRLMRRILQILGQHEFELFDTDFFVGDDEIRIVLDFKVFELPDKQKHTGPEVFHNQQNLRHFTEKYQNVWVERTYLTTIVERDYKDAETLLDDFLTGDLQKRGVPKHLRDPLEDRTIRETHASGDTNWLKFLDQFLHIPGDSK